MKRKKKVHLVIRPKKIDRIELIARTICNWHARVPDHCSTPYEPQWRHYESMARAIDRALKK